MAKKVCPKCKGKGCSHCGGTGYHKVGMEKGGDMGKKPMNAGMAALKKEAPAVAKKMGYMYGGMAKKGFKHGGLACGASNPAKNPVKRGKS